MWSELPRPRQRSAAAASMRRWPPPPPSPNSAHRGSDRLRTMEELVRFYNYFGLRTTPGRMPDHVTAELEFMHYLAHQEAEARQAAGDRESYLRAQRDFLERHLNGWWPWGAATATQGHRAPPFYRSP